MSGLFLTFNGGSMKFFLSILMAIFLLSNVYGDILMCGVGPNHSSNGGNLIFLSYDPGSGSCSAVNVSATAKRVSFGRDRGLWLTSLDGHVYIKPESGSKIYNSQISSNIRDISAHSDIVICGNQGRVYQQYYPIPITSGGSWRYVFQDSPAMNIECDWDEDFVIMYSRYGRVKSWADGYSWLYPDSPGSVLYDITSKSDAVILEDYIYDYTPQRQYDSGTDSWQGEGSTWNGRRVDCTDKGCVTLMIIGGYSYISLDGSIVYVTSGVWQDIAIEQ